MPRALPHIPPMTQLPRPGDRETPIVGETEGMIRCGDPISR